MAPERTPKDTESLPKTLQKGSPKTMRKRDGRDPVGWAQVDPVNWGWGSLKQEAEAPGPTRQAKARPRQGQGKARARARPGQGPCILPLPSCQRHGGGYVLLQLLFFRTNTPCGPFLESIEAVSVFMQLFFFRTNTSCGPFLDSIEAVSVVDDSGTSRACH